MFLGLRTIVYPAPDLDASRAWWTQVLGVPPYFDEPFYVGFNPGGYELGLDPAGDPALGARTYWGVRDVEAAAARLIALGAVVVEPITEPGEGIKLGMFRNPAGDLIGLIENPVFEVLPVAAVDGGGTGR
ncbi:VOC family protein [Diaminobutyricibacter sp. McL0618]|uniref:VOC family protein n=1 Tax=Leifsonia sp. McL0618 TaxID=3415677 RepID=UPI003CE7F0F9